MSADDAAPGLFEGVPEEGRQAALRQALPRRLDRKQVLFREGEICAGVAALEGSAYPVTAQAVEPAGLLVWPRDILRELCRVYPQIQTNILRAITGHLRDSMTRARELATERVAARVARALLRLAGQSGREVDGGVLVDHPLSRQELAEMTGTTLYTSRGPAGNAASGSSNRAPPYRRRASRSTVRTNR